MTRFRPSARTDSVTTDSAAEVEGSSAISRGVVSRRGRAEGDGLYRGLVIETDAAVNTGIYGGALLDASGELVGILDPGYSQRQWMGQAIPVSVLRAALPDLRKGWTPRHSIGMRVVPKGADRVVESIQPDGPAVGRPARSIRGRDLRSAR